jgi:putative ATP-dependent endonuclease of the OLD family
VLFTLQQKERGLFREVEHFVSSAIPGIGEIYLPPRGTNISIALRAEGRPPVMLSDMGDGVEQLIMLAAALKTTDRSHPIFLEEPESHLHPGAQRFIARELELSGRQVFIASHSPIFMHPARGASIYQVRWDGTSRTSVSRVAIDAPRAQLLEDLGVRNGDLLLRDAAVFVEGPSDRDAIEAWGRTLGIDFEELNMAVVPLEGGIAVERGAREGNRLLEAIAERGISIPALFVLDSDEREAASVQNLLQRVGDRAVVLKGRELENYLLCPRAVLAALRETHAADPARLAEIDAASVDELERLIDEVSSNLLLTVLLKRVRASIGGLTDGFLDRQTVKSIEHELSASADAGPEQIAETIDNAIQRRIDAERGGVDLQQLVKRVHGELDEVWADASLRRYAAPGEEILTAIFRRFGGAYMKRRDAGRIAAAMSEAEIDQEIKDLIDRIAQLRIPSNVAIGT